MVAVNVAYLIPRLHLSRGAYIAVTALACVAPIAMALMRFAAGVRVSSMFDDIRFALLGSLIASVLTYPAGIVGTLFSCVTTYVGMLTPTESVLMAAPLYIGAGYLQWYVLIPRYFGSS
jgi:hypothetical protein